jgi:hypothetical protein
MTTPTDPTQPPAPAPPAPVPAALAPAPQPPTPAPAPAVPAAEPDWKAEAKKWEDRAKANFEKAQAHDAYVESQKTEAQKLADRATTAEQTAATAQAEAMRWRIAAKNGISDEDAEVFLTGTTEEQLTRQAERLVALRAPAGQPQAGAATTGHRTPVEALRPGALPNPPEPTLAEQIAAAEKAGEWGTAQRLKAQQLMQLHEPNQ